MAEEERDFLMRQIKNMAKGLGKFLGVQGIKELIQYDEVSQGDLTDEELESMILMAKIEEIAGNGQFTPRYLSVKLNTTIERVEKLFNNEIYANPEELEKMNQFVEEHLDYL